jgi:hypothetical protein
VVRGHGSSNHLQQVKNTRCQQSLLKIITKFITHEIDELTAKEKSSLKAAVNALIICNAIVPTSLSAPL